MHQTISWWNTFISLRAFVWKLLNSLTCCPNLSIRFEISFFTSVICIKIHCYRCMLSYETYISAVISAIVIKGSVVGICLILFKAIRILLYGLFLPLPPISFRDSDLNSLSSCLILYLPPICWGVISMGRDCMFKVSLRTPCIFLTQNTMELGELRHLQLIYITWLSMLVHSFLA